MSVQTDTLKQLIPDDWENDLDYKDVVYVEYHWTRRKHCNEATSYRDVSGATVYKCRHNRTSVE